MSDDVSTLHDEGDDELWLISYADLLTLLIAFFVLLIASSPMKSSQFEKIASSLAGQPQSPLGALRGKVDAAIVRDQLAGRVDTFEDRNGLAIEFKEALLFDSACADLRPEGDRFVREIAGMLRALPGRDVIVEGYTDEVPIHTARFDSNWELSTARAITVLHALEEAGVEREHLSAHGFADTRAVKSGTNDEERRAANRRVVIRVE